MSTNGKQHPLRAWREKKGLSQRALAARLGGDLVSYVTLGRIERGEQAPTWAVLEALYEASGGELCPNDFIGAAPPVARLG